MESVAPDGISLQAPSLCFGSALTNLATGKRGLQRGLRNSKRTVILFVDETILSETPPLRAVWGRVGEQTCVPITGNRKKRVLYGVLNVKTGRILLHSAGVWNQDEFHCVRFVAPGEVGGLFCFSGFSSQGEREHVFGI